MEVVRDRLAAAHCDPAPQVVGFGHLGDCNLHVCIGMPVGAPSLLPLLEPFLFEWTAERNGSISAEHGVGQCKRDYMYLQRDEAVMHEFRQVCSCCWQLV